MKVTDTGDELWEFTLLKDSYESIKAYQTQINELTGNQILLKINRLYPKMRISNSKEQPTYGFNTLTWFQSCEKLSKLSDSEIGLYIY